MKSLDRQAFYNARRQSNEIFHNDSDTARLILVNSIAIDISKC